MSTVQDVLDSVFTNLNLTFCDAGEAVNLTFFYVWCIGIFFCAFFVVIQKRSEHCPGCCFGRPGLPVPVNFLVSPRNRFIYTILFGLMGFSLINTFGNLDVSLPGNNIYLSLFNKIMWSPFITVATLVLQYFPLFTAVEFPYRRIGYVTGLIYSIVWYLFQWIPRFLVYRNYANSCGSSVADIAQITITVLQDAPLVFMGLIVVAWFIYMAAFYCFWKPFHKKETFAELGDLDDPCKGIRHYHLDHVRNLLKKEIKETPKESIMNSVIMCLFPFKKNYRLPLPLLGAITAMVMIIYQAAFGLIVLALSYLVALSENYNANLKPILRANNLTAIDTVLSAILIGLPTMIVLAPIFALLLSVFLLFHMIASISKITKDVAKHGFKGDLPPKFRRLAAYWSYLGAQIGLFTIAWFFYFIIFLLIGFALVIIGLLLTVSSTTRGYAVSALVTIGIPLVWSQLLIIGQRIISIFVFLEDRKDSESKFVPVKNRRLYNVFGFVLLFYNGFAGLVGAVIRIVINILFGILLLFRLDVQFLPAHLGWWDFGHRSFRGFIYMDYCYNNAVVHVFSHLLENSILRQKSVETSRVELVEADIITESKNNAINKGARNRWFVAYTLIKNPSIQKYTACNIKLLSMQKDLQERKLYQLEHTIKNVMKDQEELEQSKKEQEIKEEKEKLATEELVGFEVKPASHPGEKEFIGVEVKPGSDPGESNEASNVSSRDFNTSYHLMKTESPNSIPAKEDSKEQSD